MAETSIFGVRSGFDTADVVDKLIQLQGRPIDLKLAQVEIQETKLEAFQGLKSRLQTFKSTLTALNTESSFLSNTSQFTKTSGTGDVVNVNPTSLATSGAFSLTVTQLAKEGKVVSAGFESITSTISQGVFEIKVGSNTTFIKIDSSNNNLDALRLAINNSGANVQATFLDDGSATNSLRLVISGKNTGSENTITARQFQNALGAGEIEIMSFTETQAAQDALINLDGIDIIKSSNTISDIVPGTILTLESTGSGNIQISTDRAGIKDKIKNFVETFNSMAEYLNGQLNFDTETFETGVLFGNFTVQNLQDTMRGKVTSEVQSVSGTFNFLAQIGISTQSDGLLILDSTRLDAALADDANNVSQLFASKSSTSHPASTFVGFTNATQAGSYELRVLGGIPQLRKVGEADFVDAEGAGNFFAGAKGTDAEGLNFRIGNLTDGSYGTIDISLGVAEQLNRHVSSLLDTTRNGPLQAELDTITSTIDNLNTTLFEMDARLELFEQNIKDRFINLEIILGRLDGQKQAFSQSIENLSNLFKNR